MIPSTVVRLGSQPGEENVPQNRTITLGSLSDFIDEDGDYTIEVMSATPFNSGAPELLAQISFTIDSVIVFKGTVYSVK